MSSTLTDKASSTATSAAAAIATGMGSMGMSMSNVMLWNWHTIGACFITPQWQIATEGAMVGTCFGVIFLVMALEGLRRSAKEFDRYLIKKHKEVAESRYHQVSPTAPADTGNPISVLPPPVTAPPPAECCTGSRKSSSTAVAPEWSGLVHGGGDAALSSVKEKPGLPGQVTWGRAATTAAAEGISVVTSGESGCSAPFRPNLWQQMMRALFHAAQFTVAYFVMMLAMNYNGYIIISIMVGAYFGSFIFSWETLWEGPRSNTSVSEEPTICCS
ncbi:ctr copper transporter [Diaporthe helianthi]|uniref:Copper transport protein n=1 Tax=Diaporthe helianthi TaxID=158607 RepID=A0A2P5I6R9_DIAHE|nr:ctr copper transporter [Diaporthe helianthi]